jgi:glucose dehydrogenase
VRMTNTVVFPGPDGGFNWGGGSFDPKLGYFFINSHDRGEVTRMVARTPGAPTKGAPVDESVQPAYVRKNAGNIVNPATGWPCQSPPWGELFAINVNTGDVAWRIPFGRVESLEALGFKDTGAYNIGGSVATAGGLLFIGATSDQYFHAYESKTGKLLRETKLPANGYANPGPIWERTENSTWQSSQTKRSWHIACRSRTSLSLSYLILSRPSVSSIETPQGSTIVAVAMLFMAGSLFR